MLELLIKRWRKPYLAFSILIAAVMKVHVEPVFDAMLAGRIF